MKNEKNYMGFLIHEIYIVNFEAFRWGISLSTNLLFLKSDYIPTKNSVEVTEWGHCSINVTLNKFFEGYIIFQKGELYSYI